MQENPIEALLKRLINDPALLKDLEKMARESVKLSLQERERKRVINRFGTLDYVNQVKLTCKLCGSMRLVYSPMIWDKIEKLHRSSCFCDSLLPEWQHLEIRPLAQSRPTCTECHTVLEEWSKEELIHKVIQLANRIK